jgi:hypothetical protein
VVKREMEYHRKYKIRIKVGRGCGAVRCGAVRCAACAIARSPVHARLSHSSHVCASVSCACLRCCVACVARANVCRCALSRRQMQPESGELGGTRAVVEVQNMFFRRGREFVPVIRFVQRGGNGVRAVSGLRFGLRGMYLRLPFPATVSVACSLYGVLATPSLASAPPRRLPLPAARPLPAASCPALCLVLCRAGRRGRCR